MFDFLTLYSVNVIKYVQNDWFFLLFCATMIFAIVCIIKYAIFGRS